MFRETEQTGIAAGLHCGALKNGRNKGSMGITVPVISRVVKFIEPLTSQNIGNLRIVNINHSYSKSYWSLILLGSRNCYGPFDYNYSDFFFFFLSGYLSLITPATR